MAKISHNRRQSAGANTIVPGDLSWSTFAAWVWRGRSTVELVVTQW